MEPLSVPVVGGQMAATPFLFDSDVGEFLNEVAAKVCLPPVQSERHKLDLATLDNPHCTVSSCPRLSGKLCAWAERSRRAIMCPQHSGGAACKFLRRYLHNQSGRHSFVLISMYIATAAPTTSQTLP